MESETNPDAKAKAWTCWPWFRARRMAQDLMVVGRRKASETRPRGARWENAVRTWGKWEERAKAWMSEEKEKRVGWGRWEDRVRESWGVEREWVLA